MSFTFSARASGCLCCNVSFTLCLRCERSFPCGRHANCCSGHAFSHKMGRTSKERVVMGDTHWHHRVIQAGWNVVLQYAFPPVEGEECLSRRLCCRCCHPECRRSSTGDAFLCAAAACTWSHDTLVSEPNKNRMSHYGDLEWKTNEMQDACWASALNERELELRKTSTTKYQECRKCW